MKKKKLIPINQRENIFTLVIFRSRLKPLVKLLHLVGEYGKCTLLDHTYRYMCMRIKHTWRG